MNEEQEMRALFDAGNITKDPAFTLREEVHEMRTKVQRTLQQAHELGRRGDLEGAEVIKGQADELIAQLKPMERELAQRDSWLAARLRIGLEWARSASIDDIEGRIIHGPLLKAAQDFAANPRCLLFVGPTGCGKSTAVVRAVWGATQRGRVDLCWASEIEILQAMKAHPLGSRGEPDIVHHAKRAKLFVLDDLGLGGRDLDGMIHGIADARYCAQKITITTSGLDVAQLVDRYGRSTLRRLTEFRGKPGKVVSAFGKATP